MFFLMSESNFSRMGGYLLAHAAGISRVCNFVMSLRAEMRSEYSAEEFLHLLRVALECFGEHELGQGVWVRQMVLASYRV